MSTVSCWLVTVHNGTPLSSATVYSSQLGLGPVPPPGGIILLRAAQTWLVVLGMDLLTARWRFSQATMNLSSWFWATATAQRVTAAGRAERRSCPAACGQRRP